MNRMNNKRTLRRSKQRVTLNERELKNIIKKAVLSELDWKTYASAADKRMVQGKYDKARDLNNAASKALSDKFGRNLSTFKNRSNGYRNVYDADAPWTTGTNAEGSEPMGYYYTSDPEYDWRDNREFERFMKNNPDDSPFEKYGDIPYDRDKFSFETDDENNERLTNNEISREVDDFTHGRYGYQKGKGWQLKESKLSSVIKESIRKVLKENNYSDPYEEAIQAVNNYRKQHFPYQKNISYEERKY